ncbi:MAG: hypothetical protein AAF481_14635 [Acidobacteriota bacterium]
MGSTTRTLNPRCLARMVLLGLLLAVTGPAAGNWWEDPSHDAESSFWWTLTDRFTPDDLRAQLLDPAGDRARWEAAYGRQAPPPASSSERMVFLDGSRTPELMPMWQAFNSFSHRRESSAWREWSDGAAYRLKAYGFSDAAALLILDGADRVLMNELQLDADKQPTRDAYQIFFRQVEKALGSEETRRAVLERDLDRLSAASRRPSGEISSLLDAVARGVRPSASLPVIEDLRTRLDPSEWQLLRSYLLREVAPGIRIQSLKAGNLGGEA